ENLLKPILMFFIDKYKNNTTELKEIANFAKKHEGVLDKDTHQRLDAYLKEEASKKTLWSRIKKFFGAHLPTKAHTNLVTNLPGDTSGDLRSVIDNKNDSIVNGDYNKAQAAIVNVVLCCQGEKKFDKEIVSECIKQIGKSKELTAEEKNTAIK